MKAGATDIDVCTRVKITYSEDPDVIGLTGTMTHPFRGIMLPDVKYIAGIRVDQKGRFTDNIVNLVESDKFEILEDISNNNKIPRKWEYIVSRLKEIDAPKKVTNAAIEMDNAMVRLELGFHTDLWEKRYPLCVKYEPSIFQLNKLIGSMGTCSACVESGYICSDCKLGAARRCTPRSKHADLYFSIVKNWVAERVVDGD